MKIFRDSNNYKTTRTEHGWTVSIAKPTFTTEEQKEKLRVQISSEQ